MKNELKSIEVMTSTDFEGVISRLLSEMGYSVESTVVAGGNELDFLVKDAKNPSCKLTLVKVDRTSGKISDTKLKKIFDKAGEDDINGSILITTSKLDGEATRYVKDKGVKVIDGGKLAKLLRKHEIDPKKPGVRAKIYETAFDLGVTESGVSQYFEKQRGRKLFGLFGVSEKIRHMGGRYAPVGCFRLKASQEVEVGVSKTIKTMEKTSRVYVNLNTAELYYVGFGFLGKNPHIISSRVLERIMDLPAESLHMLSTIFRRKEVSIEKLNEEHMLFLRENLEYLLILENKNLIASKTTGKAGYLSNILLPPFDSERYELKRFLETKKSVDSGYDADKMEYGVDEILPLLEGLFGAFGEFEDVTYMPYYRCDYVDDRNMRRQKILLAPKFSSQKQLKS